MKQTIKVSGSCASADNSNVKERMTNLHLRYVDVGRPPLPLPGPPPGQNLFGDPRLLLERDDEM
jgi:hypothetical protein